MKTNLQFIILILFIIIFYLLEKQNNKKIQRFTNTYPHIKYVGFSGLGMK